MLKMLLSHLGLRSMNSMKKVSYQVALTGKRQIAERTYEFTFEKPKGFTFKAGQHIRITLLNPTETDAKGNSRFMTLANTPQDKELVIAFRMSESAFKRGLNTMKNGEKVLIQILTGVPHGAFALHEDSSKPAIFLAGGIGIIPAYSMIKDATERRLRHKLFLFYSNRRPQDAPYLEELQELEKKNPNLTLIATMTEPEKAAKLWKGETGYINETMLEKYIDDLQSPIYYIAGLSNMVNAMKKLVREVGVIEENIRAEDFAGMKMGQMSDVANNLKKSLLFAGIGLILVLMIIVHIGAFSIFSFKSVTTIAVLLILIILICKVFIISRFKRRLGEKTQ